MLFKDRSYQFEAVTVPDSVNKVVTDLQYGPGDRHKLDLYLPEGKGPFPIVLDIHGGGLLRGEKSSVKLGPSLKLTEAGFAVASMNYTLNSAGHNDFPNQVAEVRAASQYLQDNASKYALDPNQLNLIGESSGAQLAVLAAASFSKGVAVGNLPAMNFDDGFPKITHVIALYGPYQVDKFPEQFQQLGIQPNFAETGQANSFEGIMLNDQTPKSVPDLVAQANPATYLTTAMPPLMLIAGTADAVVPYVQSQQLAAEYEDVVKRPAKTIWVTGGHHGITDFDTGSIYQDKVAFLEDK